MNFNANIRHKQGCQTSNDNTGPWVPGGMTEVTTDTTDRRPIAVGGIGNYVAVRSVVSEFLLNKWEYRNTKL